ncbi:MAG: GGDEF domain-containing protein [Thermoleophilia bacterium]|nr:GGDEF domain-containing protein [Thermoleophilia bacterium]
MSPSPTAREMELAARRRLVLLAAVLAATLVPLALGAWHAWPLLGLPVVLSFALSGPTGLGLVASVAALAMALVSANPGADGTSLATAFVAFVALGVVVGMRHYSLEHALDRESQRSLTDKLTGLPNYAYLSETLPLELRRADRNGGDVSLVLLDLDHFKAFNDRFGHEAGNRMLVAAADAMRATARGSDVVGRFGGEEFAVIVAGGAGEAAEAAERVRDAIQAVRITVDPGVEVGVTTSAGVAQRQRGEVMQQLIKRADGALYAAKAAGRNRVVTAPADEVSRRRRAA